MKSFRLLLFVLILCYQYTQAQVTAAIKGGIGASTLKFKYEDAYPGRAVWYGGFMVRQPFSSQFFFQPELLYSLRGYHHNADATTLQATNVGYGYLSLPLLLGYKPAKNLSLLAGPELGYMLSAKEHYGGHSYNILQYVNYRFSVDGDAGAVLAISPRLSVEARVVLGLTSLYHVVYTDVNGGTVEATKSGRNRLVQAGVCYALK